MTVVDETRHDSTTAEVAPQSARWPSIRRMLWRRTITGTITLIAVSAGIFAVAAASPFDPLTAHLGQNYQSATIAQRHAAEAAYGLDQSWWSACWHWWVNLLHGDLGWSSTLHQPVTTVLAERLPFTIGLSAAALVAAVIISIAAGTRAGLRAATPTDKAVTGTATVLAATPPFVLSLLLVAVISVGAGWLPAAGAAAPGQGYTAAGLLEHGLLPWIALTVSQLPWLTLSTRSAVAAAASSDPVTAARARGIRGWPLLSEHIWPAAIIPTLALLGTRLPELVAGAAIVEAVFGWPGVADALVTSATALDFPLLATLSMTAAATVLIGSALSDVAVIALNPHAEVTA